MDTSNTIQQEIAAPDINTVKKPKVRKRAITFGSTKWITYTALFTALSIAMKYAGQHLTLTPEFKITAVYAVWLVGAAVLGPVAGGTICAISDILVVLTDPVPGTEPNPLITVACAMYGIVAGLAFKLPLKNYTAKFIVAGITATFIASMCLDSFAIWFYCRYILKLGSYLNKGIFAYVFSRWLQSIVAFANIPLAIALLPALKSQRLLPPLSEPKAEKQSELNATVNNTQSEDNNNA